MKVVYYCTGCSNRTLDASSLIQGKGGCRSCGKSGYKCPRCGMMMKIRKFGGEVPEVPRSTIESGVKLGAVKKRGLTEKADRRNIKINRKR